MAAMAVVRPFVRTVSTRPASSAKKCSIWLTISVFQLTPAPSSSSVVASVTSTTSVFAANLAPTLNPSYSPGSISAYRVLLGVFLVSATVIAPNAGKHNSSCGTTPVSTAEGTASTASTRRCAPSALETTTDSRTVSASTARSINAMSVSRTPANVKSAGIDST